MSHPNLQRNLHLINTDDPIAAGISPDFNVPWNMLFERVVSYMLGNPIKVEVSSEE